MELTAGRSVSRVSYWRVGGRCLVFALASTSIGCLLADFYGCAPMRVSVVAVFQPSMVLLWGGVLLDLRRGDGQLRRAVAIGLLGGLIAAVAYDVFRLPFVFAREWGIDSVVPPMNLFKVFPRFGAMILGQPRDVAHYATITHIVGWLYHFSNGVTFGVMYLALIGDASRRHWSWAIVFAMVLELGMLLTPYPGVFGIPVTPRFVAVTMAAHAIFGLCLGLVVRRMGRKQAIIPTDMRSSGLSEHGSGPRQ